MYSTDYNLNNPTSILELEIRHLRSIFYVPEVRSISREQYHATKVHDNAVYVMMEFPHEIYYGDSLLSRGVLEAFKNKPKYYIGYDNNTNEYLLVVDRPNLHYTSYMNQPTIVAKYKDPQVAINKLVECSRLGTETSIAKNVYESLMGYIKKDNTISQSIISIIASFGYRETPEFQMLIDYLQRNEYFIKDEKVILSILLDTRFDNHLFKMYADIYTIIENYKFFKDKKYDLDINEYIDLKDPMNEIIRLIIK